MNRRPLEKLSLLLVVAGLIPAILVASRHALPAGTTSRGFVALDAGKQPVFVIARNAVDATAGDLFGDPAEEWIAALPHGEVVVRSGDDGSLGSIPAVGVRAVAVGDGRLYMALGGAILELEPLNSTSTFVSVVEAAALTAADFDRDGAVELVASRDDGSLVFVDPAEGETFPLEGSQIVALTSGDFLGIGREQLALLQPGGTVSFLDPFEEAEGLCYLGGSGSSPGEAAPGFSSLPIGDPEPGKPVMEWIVTLSDQGSFMALDPHTCEVFDIDLTELEVTHDPVFTSAGGGGAPPTGGQIPGDCNQDGTMDISDAVCLLGHLFLGAPVRVPCGDGSLEHPANLALLEMNGDGSVDLSDPIYILSFLFIGGPPPLPGTECLAIPGCPELCPR